jgi:phosphate transport system protein
MMRGRLVDQQMKIHEKLIKMSVLVEESVGHSVKALTDSNIKMAEEVILKDDMIDLYENEIEDLCIEMIATQNPMAGDLRRLFTILKLISDLERIGDNAENIAKTVKRLEGQVMIKPLIDIPKMAKIAKDMIYNSINAYIDMNYELAVITVKMDDEVDRLYENIYNELLDLLEGNAQYKDQVIGLLLIGRYLERIADHATNICERVAYMITGKRMEY